MRFPSVLRFGCGDDQPIQICIDVNLAGEPGSVAQLRHQVQHIRLASGAGANPIKPGRVDVDVAGCTGAVAAAIAVDTLYAIIGRGAHERCAGVNIHSAAAAGERNEGYFRHIYLIVICLISKDSASADTEPRPHERSRTANLSQTGAAKKSALPTIAPGEADESKCSSSMRAHQADLPTRRRILKNLTAALIALNLPQQGVTEARQKMYTRPIPATKEPLPVIGCGTYRTFDVDARPEPRALLLGVLKELFAAGGSVIDTSPMYGLAEGVVGDLLAQAQNRSRAFLATKVWTSGKQSGLEQINRSFTLLQDRRIDLIQVHNLLDWRVQLATLRDLKAAGRIRYVGITHYSASAFAEVESVLRSESLDFLQINYAMNDTAADRRILPLAADRGVAVIANRPFGGGGLLGELRGRPLPPWAQEIDCQSWAQVLLKFVLSHPAITCVIPATASPEHMLDNIGAGFGRMPDPALRARMISSL
jgi:diketogulonate reductase-like aldo/keto reductase